MTPSPALPLLGDLLSWLRWHRRSVAAALAVLALLAAVRSGRTDGAPTVQVLVAARDLAAGQVITEGDLRAAPVPAERAPQGVVRAEQQVLGRVVALPVRRGEVVTDVRLVGSGLLAALGPGTVAAPVHLVDPATAGLAQVGDVVDVLAAGEVGEGRVAASAVRVLSRTTTGTDAVVMVAVGAAGARALAAAAAVARLSLVVRAR